MPPSARDLPALGASALIQGTLGALFGHVYDARIFMATAYLVGTGRSPYLVRDLSAVFRSDLFQGMTSIGYPPPWPLALGLLHRLLAPALPNLFAYNLGLKVPIILANIGLAYLVAAAVRELGGGEKAARSAWLFMLFNPFLLYFGVAWGQFDVIVALFTLAGLRLLVGGRVKSAAALLTLAVCLKPTALPVLPVAWVYLWGRSPARAAAFALASLAGGLALCIGPFLTLGWDAGPILENWNAHFVVGGGLSWMSFYELLRDSYRLPGAWWLLGLAWAPALAVGLLGLRQGVANLADLLKKSTALILIFFLTRTWLSEPNIILVLPFVLILVFTGEIHPLALAGVIALPFAFTVFNTSPPQLLFLVAPERMSSWLAQADEYREARLFIRTLLVLPWQALGWWIVVACFRRSSLAAPARPAVANGRFSGIGPA